MVAMIRRAHGIIGRVRELGGRILVGLGAIVAAVAAIGYAYVYLGIASPPGSSLGTVGVPAPGAVEAVLLDDGRPVYVVEAGGAVTVLDARAPRVGGEVEALVAWCADVNVFLDLRHGGTFAPGGEVLGESAPSGLRVYATEPSTGGAGVTVHDNVRLAGSGSDDSAALDCTRDSAWVVHAPTPDEVFDPSAAIDQEPPGWIWIEGRLEAAAGAARVCDGLDGTCATWGAVGGIDPATVEPTAGLFLGRVAGGALVDLVTVPDIPDLGEPT
jgi:hypothetical protein